MKELAICQMSRIAATMKGKYRNNFQGIWDSAHRKIRSRMRYIFRAMSKKAKIKLEYL